MSPVRPEGGMTCVECGKQVPALVGGSCPECFAGKNAVLVVPDVLDVELCAHCDARHVGAHWLDPAEDDDLQDIREAAVRAAVSYHSALRGAILDIEETVQDERNFKLHLHAEGEVEETPVTADKDILVRMKRSVCDRCSRMFGGYYAAVIQLRADGRDVTEAEIERAHKIIGSELDRLRATGNREAFLTKSGRVPGGFDYYMGDIEGTRAISRTVIGRLGASLQETAKLAGRKEGNDIYRVTFLVRINMFAPGDYAVLAGEEPVQVSSSERGKCICYRLRDKRRDRVDLSDLRRLGGSEVLVRAIVVSRQDPVIQLMDPVTFQTVDVAIPEGWEQEPGDSVWVLRFEGQLYLPRIAPPPPEPEKPRRKRRRRAPLPAPGTAAAPAQQGGPEGAGPASAPAASAPAPSAPVGTGTSAAKPAGPPKKVRIDFD